MGVTCKGPPSIDMSDDENISDVDAKRFDDSVDVRMLFSFFVGQHRIVSYRILSYLIVSYLILFLLEFIHQPHSLQQTKSHLHVCTFKRHVLIESSKNKIKNFAQIATEINSKSQLNYSDQNIHKIILTHKSPFILYIV